MGKVDKEVSWTETNQGVCWMDTWLGNLTIMSIIEV